MDLIRAIDKSKETLIVHCGLWVDIVWYRKDKHVLKRRWQNRYAWEKKGHNRA